MKKPDRKIKNLVLDMLSLKYLRGIYVEMSRSHWNYVGLEFRRKFWVGDENFGVPTMEVAF